jgi:hypothetical protein
MTARSDKVTTGEKASPENGFPDLCAGLLSGLDVEGKKKARPKQEHALTHQKSKRKGINASFRNLNENIHDVLHWSNSRQNRGE